MQRQDKKAIMEQFALHKGDTGSPEVQIAILTERIESLKSHLEVHANDNHSRRGILLMVAKRRKLINYIKKEDMDRYESIISRLKLRK